MTLTPEQQPDRSAPMPEFVSLQLPPRRTWPVTDATLTALAREAEGAQASGDHALWRAHADQAVARLLDLLPNPHLEVQAHFLAGHWNSLTHTLTSWRLLFNGYLGRHEPATPPPEITAVTFLDWTLERVRALREPELIATLARIATSADPGPPLDPATAITAAHHLRTPASPFELRFVAACRLGASSAPATPELLGATLRTPGSTVEARLIRLAAVGSLVRLNRCQTTVTALGDYLRDLHAFGGAQNCA